MAKMSASEIAAKWKRNTAGSVQSYKAGVEAVTVAPTEKAAAAVDRYVEGTVRAAEDGSFVEGCKSVSLEAWKARTVGAGAERIGKGVADAEPRVQEFLGQLLPHAERVSQEVSQMPKGTIDDSIARASTAIRRMSEFKFRKSKR